MASLLDDKTSSIGSPKAAKPKSGEGSNQTIKLAAALVLFAVAGLVFAWSQGWILSGSDSQAAAPSPEDVQQLQEQQKKADEIRKSGTAQDAGA